jgi:hypothetical protein
VICKNNLLLWSSHFNSHFSLSFCWQALSRLKAKGFVTPSKLKVLGEIASG